MSGFVRMGASGALALLAAACSPQAKPVEAAQPVAPAPAVDTGADGTLLYLEARAGRPDTLWIVATYKVRRELGVLSKKLELDVENATPGSEHALALDGFELARLVPNRKGEADFELSASGDDRFPEGFVEPRAGSTLRVGSLGELRFLPLERLVDLRADIAGPAPLEGKVTFRIERLGEAVTREFQVKVTHAEESSKHAVHLDGTYVGDLVVDLGGKGKLRFSTKENEPFPAGFVEPRVGTPVVVEGLFEGRLLGAAGHEE